MSTPKEVLEARKIYKSVEVIAPTLDDNLNPKIQVREYSDCPCKEDQKGQCNSCSKFIGYYTEDGTIFSYGVYEGFCNSL